MIVILNNGTRISIPKEAAQAIAQALVAGEVQQWQIHMDGRNKEISSIINLREVSAICLPGDIMPDAVR